MSKVQPRDIAPMLQGLRNFLLGRDHITALRFQDVLATRSPPPPQIPDGPCHNLAKNYYCTRDVRREVKPPEIIASKTLPIASGTTGGPVECKKAPTPGSVYRWD